MSMAGHERNAGGTGGSADTAGGGGADGAGQKGLRGIHVFMIISTFFGVIFLANGIMMYMALSTHTGIERHNAYRSGLKYNERIRASEAQAARGWQTSLVLSPAGNRLKLDIKNRAGIVVPGLKVTAKISRPATIDFDQEHVMMEANPGRYEAGFAALAPGKWIVNIKAARAGDKGDVIVYRLRKRLWLDPKK